MVNFTTSIKLSGGYIQMKNTAINLQDLFLNNARKERIPVTIYLMNGLVFFSPVALLIRTEAGLSLSQFFILQAIFSITIFVFEIPTGKITDIIGYKKRSFCHN